jgi:hypothetical protein
MKSPGLLFKNEMLNLFEVLIFLHMSSWIDWYTISENQLDSSKVIQDGVLA